MVQCRREGITFNQSMGSRLRGYDGFVIEGQFSDMSRSLINDWLPNIGVYRIRGSF
jgi:hypothetical protein